MGATTDTRDPKMVARQTAALARTAPSPVMTPAAAVKPQSELRQSGLSEEAINAYKARMKEQEPAGPNAAEIAQPVAQVSGENDSKAMALLRGFGKRAMNFLANPTTSKVAIGLIIGETAFALAGTYDIVFAAKTGIETYRSSAGMFSLTGFAPTAAYAMGSRVGIIAFTDRLFKWDRVAADMTEMQRKATPAMLYLGIAALTAYDAAANVWGLLGFPHI